MRGVNRMRREDDKTLKNHDKTITYISIYSLHRRAGA